MSRSRASAAPSAARLVLGIAVSIAGAGLLVWQVRHAGTSAILESLGEIGWGFVVILALGAARFVVRALAWTVLMDRAPLGPAFAATLAGDAIGNVTPLGLLVSEPVKSLYLREQTPVSVSLPALAAENFFYTVSVAIFIILGTVAMLEAFAVPEELRWAGLLALAMMSGVLAAALWIGWREPALLSAVIDWMPARLRSTLGARARHFESRLYDLLRRREQALGVVAACEAAFHALSFAEAYYTLWLVTGRSAPIAAFVLDTFNRIVNVVFRAMPLRIGVDEASTAIVAPAVGFSPAVGVTIALARKGRMLVWAGAGILLAIRKGLRLGDVMQPRR